MEGVRQMKIRSNARHCMGIALSLGLAATAGCQAPKPTGADEQQLRQSVAQTQTDAAQAASDMGLTKQPIQTEEFKLIAGNQPLTNAVVTVGDQFMVPDERGVIRLPKSAETDGKTMITVEAEGFVPVSMPVVGGAGLSLTPIDPARTNISAANGGIARNSDGTVEVSFAPGSLNKDANISVTKIFAEQHNPLFAPQPEQDFTRKSLGQYSYHLDLGGAELTSSAGVVVKFKVDGALKQHFEEEMAAPRGIEGSNIKDDFSRDTEGNFWFGMKHDAPLPKPEEVMASAVSKFSLLAKSCSQFPNDQYVWTVRNVIVSQTSGNCDNRGDGGVNFHDYRFNSGHCQYWRDSKYQCEGRTLVEYNTYSRPAPSSGVVATVRWSSDDGRIQGPVPNVYVSFSHAGSDANSPYRAPKTQDWTDGDGQASGWGAQGVGGWASASPPAYYIRTNSAYYGLNCASVPLYLIKNKPVVRFAYQNRRGINTPATITVPTSHGGYAVASAGAPTAAITMKSVASESEQFSVAGSWQPVGDVWVDAVSPAAAKIQWNNYNTGGNATSVPTNIWFSKQIGATLTYLSNDDSAPADQRPVQQWNGKAAKADVAFAHEVSAYGGKPAGRDTLAFSQAAGSAGTWGINGENGSVTATVTGPDAQPVKLEGKSNYTIAGNTVGVKVNANLPELTITIREMETEDTQFKLVYELDGVEKEMRLARNGSTLQFSIPVEDQLNVPRKHTFKIKWLGTENGNTTFWMANRAAFPSLTVFRAQRLDHPALDGTLNAAK